MHSWKALFWLRFAILNRRKNPVHFQEYSHDDGEDDDDSDDDKDDEDLPECPYGTSCYR